MDYRMLQVLEPLQMACTIDVPRIAEPALGCLHKLVCRLPSAVPQLCSLLASGALCCRHCVPLSMRGL